MNESTDANGTRRSDAKAFDELIAVKYFNHVKYIPETFYYPP